MSYKTEKNILSLITKNKFRSNVNVNHNNTESMGCVSCGKCTLCKNFLIESNVIKSPNTNQTFKIKSRLTCSTKNVIYLLHDKICNIIYVGYTTHDMASRWTRHKSHIKSKTETCEISKHFIQHANSNHKLNRNTSQSAYTESLKHQIGVLLIECVDNINSEQDLINTLRTRENFWQNALKATAIFGGINVRENHPSRRPIR